MTDRLVSEIMYHIDLYGMKPTRIRFTAQSLLLFVTADIILVSLRLQTSVTLKELHDMLVVRRWY